jgi:hypothetical protein
MPHDEFGTYTKEISLMPSTIETVDGAMFDWLAGLDMHATTNKGWKGVPSIWVSAERAHQIKNNQDLRDENGILKLPLVTLARMSIDKDPTFKGVAWAHIPPYNDYKGGAITVARVVNQDKTSNFKNAFSHRKFPSDGQGQLNFPSKTNLTVYNTYSMPIPTYISVMYSVGIRAEYQQQINEILTPFITKTGQINNFFINKEGHKFEGFIQQGFAQGNNAVNLGEGERMYDTTVNIRILAYLLGEGKNAERPKVTVRENAVQIVQMRERAGLSEIPDHIDPTVSDRLSKKGFYRE